MLFAIHADALFSAISADSTDIEKILLSSKIVASDEIISLFELRFSESPTYSQLLQSLLARMGVGGQIKYINHSQEADDIVKYEEAAHAGGKNFAIISPNSLTSSEREIIKRRGNAIRLLDQISYEGSKIGFEPFEMHTLPHNGKRNPASLIGRFFKESSKVIFYDKFINSKSCSLINCLVQEIAANGNIDVVTSAEAPLTPAQIRAHIHLKAGQSLQVEVATAETVALLHDRYCYIDEIYEIHIPRGLDCFGLGPRWKTVNATIYIYDCQNGTPSHIGCQARSGRLAERVIPFKSCLISPC